MKRPVSSEPKSIFRNIDIAAVFIPVGIIIRLRVDSAKTTVKLEDNSVGVSLLDIIASGPL